MADLGGLAFDSGRGRVSENLYVAGGSFSARELAADPRDPTRTLLERFMVPILDEGTDIVDMVLNPI